jgi:hypothetical protein
VIQPGLVIAAAGRRIDDARFPRANEHKVKKAIRSALEEAVPTLVVASAACGADILVLETARDLGIPTRIVLPFSPNAFRKRSVADCDGNWASRYDQLLMHVLTGDDGLIILSDAEPASDDEANAAYRMVTEELVRHVELALRSNHYAKGGALVIWDQERKNESDETGRLLDAAHSRDWRVVEISTHQPA